MNSRKFVEFLIQRDKTYLLERDENISKILDMFSEKIKYEDLKTFKCILTLIQKNYPQTLVEKTNKCTILHLFSKNFYDEEDLEKFKCILSLIQNNYPQMLVEKDDLGLTFLHIILSRDMKLNTIKYIFNFVKNVCPDLFLEKDNYGRTTNEVFSQKPNCIPPIIYVMAFFKNNCPEIYYDTYNKEHLILPLTFQIQN